MKESYWGYWLIVLGVFVILIMLLVQNVTSTNTQDYYLAKEIAEAAMVDAVDYGYYNQYGEVRIIKEKFVESFVRRFAESANMNSTYKIEFYEIYETPPKVSIKVSTNTSTFNIMGDSSSFEVTNKIDMVLEADPSFKYPKIMDDGKVEDCGKENCLIPSSSTKYVTHVDGIRWIIEPPTGKLRNDKDCKVYTATFDKVSADNISYALFRCIPDKSGKCDIFLPQIYKGDGNVYGWNTTKGSKNNLLIPGQKVTISGDVTYFAVTDDSQIKVDYTFIQPSVGVKSISASKLSCVIKASQNSCQITFPTVTTQDGYIFKGWSTAQDGSSGLVEQGKTVTIYKSGEVLNRTYYAIVEKTATNNSNTNTNTNTNNTNNNNNTNTNTNTNNNNSPSKPTTNDPYNPSKYVHDSTAADRWIDLIDKILKPNKPSDNNTNTNTNTNNNNTNNNNGIKNNTNTNTNTNNNNTNNTNTNINNNTNTNTNTNTNNKPNINVSNNTSTNNNTGNTNSGNSNNNNNTSTTNNKPTNIPTASSNNPDIVNRAIGVQTDWNNRPRSNDENNHKTQDSFPYTYEDETAKLTITKEKYHSTINNSDTTYYLIHLVLTDYNRLHTALTGGTNGFGTYSTGKVSDSARNVGAILALEGDYAYASKNTYIGGQSVPGKGYSVRDGVFLTSDGLDPKNIEAKNACNAYYNKYTGVMGDCSTLKSKSLKEAIESKELTDTFKFGKNLLVNGEITVKANKEKDGHRQSNFFGYVKPGEFYFVVAEGQYNNNVSFGSDGTSYGLIPYERAEILKDLGCSFVGQLDGGTSVILYYQGKLLQSTYGRNKEGDSERSWLPDYVYFK